MFIHFRSIFLAFQKNDYAHEQIQVVARCIIQPLRICLRLSSDNHIFLWFYAWQCTRSMYAMDTDAWLSHRVVRQPFDMDSRRRQTTTIMSCTAAALLGSKETAANVVNAVMPGIYRSHDQMNMAANMAKVLSWEHTNLARILHCVLNSLPVIWGWWNWVKQIG